MTSSTSARRGQQAGRASGRGPSIEGQSRRQKQEARPAQARDPSLRARTHRPSRADAVTDFGDARLWSETTRIDLRVAEVANPRPGDRIEIDGDAFLIQGEPVRDRERLVWTIDLRPA